MCWSWVNRDIGAACKEEWSWSERPLWSGVGAEGNRRGLRRGRTDHTGPHTDGEGNTGGAGSQLERLL